MYELLIASLFPLLIIDPVNKTSYKVPYFQRDNEMYMQLFHPVYRYQPRTVASVLNNKFIKILYNNAITETS